MTTTHDTLETADADGEAHPSRVLLCVFAACCFVLTLMRLADGFLYIGPVMGLYALLPSLWFALSIGGLVYGARHVRALWARKLGILVALLIAVHALAAFGAHMAMFGIFLEQFQSPEARLESLGL